MSNFTPEIAREIISALQATNSLVQSWSPEMATLKADLKHLKEEFQETERIVKGSNGDSLRGRIDKLGYQIESTLKEIENIKENIKVFSESSKKDTDDFKSKCEQFKNEISNLEGKLSAMESAKQKDSETKWSLKTKIILALITTIGGIITTYLTLYFTGVAN